MFPTTTDHANGCGASASGPSPTTKCSPWCSAPASPGGAFSGSPARSWGAPEGSPASPRWTSLVSRTSRASARQQRGGSSPSPRSGGGPALRRPGPGWSTTRPSLASSGPSCCTGTASGSSWWSPTGPRPLELVLVRDGGVDDVSVQPADVLQAVLTRGGRSFAVAHNHPGGTLDPSVADLMLTRRLDQAAATIGLRFLGHILVAGDQWMAMPAANATAAGASGRGRGRSSRAGSTGEA